MPKFTSKETEVDIKRLSKENYSYRQIRNKLKQEGVNVSISTITRVLKNIGIRRQAANQKNAVPKFNRIPVKRLAATVKKVKILINKRNPATYRCIKSKTNLRLRTIHKVIHQDLEMDTRKKTQVYKLTINPRMTRKTNCRKLYENNLAGKRWENEVDEAFIYLDNSNGQTQICYM